MKIMFLTRSLENGGAERQLVLLAKGLKTRGHKVSVATFYSLGSFRTDLEDNGVEVHTLHKKSRWDVLGFLFQLIKLVRRENPDILHGYLQVPNIITILLKPIFPRISMIWGIRSSNANLEEYDSVTKLSYYVQDKLSRFPDLIISNSHAGKKNMLDLGYPEHKLKVIPNGIDTNYFKYRDEYRKLVRTDWGIQDSEILIGLVGRLDPIKGHRIFLQSAARLVQEENNIRLVFVGHGNVAYKEELIKDSKELGLEKNLIWAGERRDIVEIFSSLDIFVSASLVEGFPNVVGEAMACQINCVVTDVGDSKWIVGENGIVVLPNNDKELYEGLKEAVKQKYSKEDKKQSRERIVKNFSIQALIDKTERVFVQERGE